MKYEYIKNGKFNYQGNQLRKGAIIEVESLGNLPENWFKEVKETKVKKVKIEKKIDERVEKDIIKPKRKTKEVIDNGDNENTD